MATERRKTKRKPALKDELEKPTKEEYAVAKYLRFNAPSKEGKFLGNSVQYFIGSKVVDILLDSKWATKNTKTNPLFTTRGSCVNYCERLLEKGFFHRAAKPEKKDKKRRLKESEKAITKDEPTLSKKSEKKSKKGDQLALEAKKDKDGEEKKEEVTTSKQVEEKTDTQKDDSAEDKKRKKKKLKLEMHDKQVFLDGPELYVWIYDPVPVKTFIIGLLLVFGAIAVCLFPLWPPEVKIGIYYLSLAAAGFIGLILALCVLRMVVFIIVWLMTFGKVSFWLLPNLTEDVGFFDSFLPVYKYELKDAKKKEEKPSIDAAADDGEATLCLAETEVSTDLVKDKTEVGTDEGREFVEEIKEDDRESGDDEDEEEDNDEEDKDENEEGNDEDGEVDEEDDENGHSGSSNDNGYEIIDAEDDDDDDEDADGSKKPENKKDK